MGRGHGDGGPSWGRGGDLIPACPTPVQTSESSLVQEGRRRGLSCWGRGRGEGGAGGGARPGAGLQPSSQPGLRAPLRRREVSGHSTSPGFWVLPCPAVLTAAALPSLGGCPKREGREVVAPALAGRPRRGRS